MKTALLIDAENISAKYIDIIMEEARQYGPIIIKRVFGDFSLNNLASWRNAVQDYAFTAIQMFHTSYKNMADTALVIEAMDIMHDGKVECIVIASSDNDYTALACRLSEGGVMVVGMGEMKTPSSLRAACDHFICLNSTWTGSVLPSEEEALTYQEKTEVLMKERPYDCEIVERIIDEILENSTDWYPLANLGNQLRRRLPHFDAKMLGYGKLSDYIHHLNRYETMTVASAEMEPCPKVVYLRKKQQTKEEDNLAVAYSG